MDFWRISNYRDLSGEGGRLAPSRWNTEGNPVVYLAASAAGALLEVLVHLEIEDDEPLPLYNLLHITATDTLAISSLRVPSGDAWKTDEFITRKLGDTWLKSQRSALARVPSAIVPGAFNYLLNPLHPDAAKIKIKSTQRFPLDPRLRPYSRR